MDFKNWMQCCFPRKEFPEEDDFFFWGEGRGVKVWWKVYMLRFHHFKRILSRFYACSGSQKRNLCSGQEQSQLLRFYTVKFHIRNYFFFLSIGDQNFFCLDHILFRCWVLALFYCSFA